MKTCKFCLKSFEKLAKAHIIPRSFYKQVRGKGHASFLVKIGETGLQKQQFQAGIYDEELVCDGCEKIFSPYDDHGYKVITKTLKAPQYRFLQNDFEIIPLEGVDYTKFKLFILSVAWRIGASDSSFFSPYTLGVHLNRIKSLIIAGDAGGDDDYCFYMNHVKDRPIEDVIYNPMTSKMGGTKNEGDARNVLFFDLQMASVIVKMDRRPFVGEFREAFSTRARPLFMSHMDFKGGLEEMLHNETLDAARAAKLSRLRKEQSAK